MWCSGWESAGRSPILLKKMKSEAGQIIVECKAGGLKIRLLEVFLARAAKAGGVRGRVNILITGNRRIQELNCRFRGKSSPTDVLSFPAAMVGGVAGDIAISLDIAAGNARALGHSVADEVRILILHGILHLAGYDHEDDRGQMEKKETALRKKLGLPTGLIERSLTGDNMSSIARGPSLLSSRSSKASNVRRRNGRARRLHT
jgi:probable rRNA maturation factor